MSDHQLVRLHVDLSGSRLGEQWLAVDLTLAPPEEWSPQRLRQKAAAHYAVPLDQVGEPEIVDAGEARR